MRMKFLRGRRSSAWTAAMVSLILIPAPAALAQHAPRSEIDPPGQGLGLAERDEKVVTRAVRYARGNYAWPYAVGPHYGEVDRKERRDPGVLHTAVGSFRLSTEGVALPAELKTVNRLDGPESTGFQYFIVQVDPYLAGAAGSLRATVEKHGGKVLHSMPVASFIVRLESKAMKTLGGADGILAIEPYHPALKLDPTIGRVPLADPMKALSEVYELEILVFETGSVERVAQTVADLGGNVIGVGTDQVRAEVHRSKLSEVAALESVYKVFEHVPKSPHGEETTTTQQTGRYGLGRVPYHEAGVHGGGTGVAGTCTVSGGACTENADCNDAGTLDVCPGAPQVLMVLDTGIQLDAGDLSDTRTSAGTPGPGHRKVREYAATSLFLLGQGDTEGCDAPQQGAFTHGHVVSATALGWGTDVLGPYGGGWTVTDAVGDAWKLDGVAPRALLVAYDGQRTPNFISCADPLVDTIVSGDLYPGGALDTAYLTHGARVTNFSWGVNTNTYSADAIDVDEFLFDHKDAMVFISAGNAGQDANNDNVPDTATLANPATAKNSLAIGASNAPNDNGATMWVESRAAFSSTGPAVGNRVAPQLMSPGNDNGGLGVASEFSCRSDDNDQTGAVLCDQISGISGTSFASPAAAGAAALVRDYFAQGFYPDGTSGNPGNGAEQVPTLSGALVKSLLVASANFLDCTDHQQTETLPPGEPWNGRSCPFGSQLTREERFNNEQGYGRIQLDNVLPLQTWAESPSGLIVADGGIPGGVGNLSGLDGIVDASETDEDTFNVCDGGQELRAALSWIEDQSAALTNDLNLELISPSGVIYYGNYFTDDDDRDGTIAVGTENCPSLDGSNVPPVLDASEWSLPVCQRADLTVSPRDTENPTEGIFLSPDPCLSDPGNCPGGGAASQTEEGDWTIRVVADGVTAPGGQRYAVAIAGGVCLGSSTRLGDGAFVCNDDASLSINETDETDDPAGNLTTAEVESRVTVHVLDGLTIVDTEPGTALGLTRPDAGTLRWVADGILLTDGTAQDPGNGVLDVRHGNTIQVIYADETCSDTTNLTTCAATQSADPDQERVSQSAVDCETHISVGTITFPDFGRDREYLVQGGCERNARGQFEFGFPDKYMDAGEELVFNFAFGSDEQIELENVEVAMRCVHTDLDSDADCRPGTTDCADPDRTNNTSCDQNDPDPAQYMTIANSPRRVGVVPRSSSISANFPIAMAATISGTPEIELVLEVTAATSGKTKQGVGVTRQRLDVDESSILYSTDFPTGGSEIWDYNGNELVEDPTTNIGDFLQDYRFETKVYGDLTDGGTKNASIGAPWNFDAGSGGFRSGLVSVTDEQSIADTIAQWGEDKNFNDIDDLRCNGQAQNTPCPSEDPAGDAFCIGLVAPSNKCLSVEDRDPQSAPGTPLDKNWSTAGGCGWQTRAPGTCTGNAALGCYDNATCSAQAAGTCNLAAGQATGGIWHTGRIGGTTGGCFVIGIGPGNCQSHETVSGATGQLNWFEILTTPVIEKVNGDDYTAEITNWAWNQQIDLPDSNVSWTWELDTDSDALQPVDLFSDFTTLNFGTGPFGAMNGAGNPDLTNGFSVFAPRGVSGTGNGTLGNNREGDLSCFFETGANGGPNAPDEDLGIAGPPDDDLANGYCTGNPNVLCLVDSPDCDLDGGPCVFDNALVDEYVATNGPIRNMDIGAFNGPDMRFNTLEDFFGVTELRFDRGSNGAEQPPPPVIRWREVQPVGRVTETN